MSEFKISGTVTAVTNQRNGTTKKGQEYQSCEITVKEHSEQYPNEISLGYMGMGDKLQYYKVPKVGDEVDVEFKCKQNEYKDKKYNQLSIWKMNILSSSVVGGAKEDDLPF